MLNKVIKFINGLGDWNHLFIGMVLMVVVTFIAPELLYHAATAISSFYFSKEYHSYQRGNDYLTAFIVNLWSRHDRRQSFLLWIGVWAYAFAVREVL